MTNLFTASGPVPTSNRQFVSKGWGYEDWIWNTPLYCGKVLFIKKDKKVSWHYHNLKDEVFYVQDGKMLVLYGPDDDINKANQIVMGRGDVFHVTVGMRHRMIGLEDTHVFEFSTQHFDSDSIRLERGD
jgi:mannose-6-phosphate isomerase-like protein (cupin superfamily)